MPIAFLKLLNWKVGAVLIVVALAGVLVARDRAQQRRIAELEIQMRTRPPTVTTEDFTKLITEFEAGRRAEIVRANEQFREILEIVAGRSGPVLRREVGPPGPPGRPGAPGAAGQPGTPGVPAQPLIPEGKVREAREVASERIVIGLHAGHLINCPTPGLEDADAIELLRDPTGRLLSGTRCVRSVRDEIKIAPAPPSQDRLPYNVGAFAKVTSVTPWIVGLEYQNRAFGGYYRVQVGRSQSLGFSPNYYELGWTLPIR